MTLEDDDHIVLLGDSAQVSTLPTITRCWTRIGHQRVILTPGMRAEKRWDFGTVNPLTGETLHIVHHRRNNVGFRRLLAAISRTCQLPSHPQRKVYLFVDNDKAHTARSVTQLLEKHSHRIQVEFLPAYAPEMNPQEDIWQHMRRRVTHNHYFGHMSNLLKALEEFHHQLEQNPEQVLRLLTKWTRLIAT